MEFVPLFEFVDTNTATFPVWIFSFAHAEYRVSVGVRHVGGVEEADGQENDERGERAHEGLIAGVLRDVKIQGDKCSDRGPQGLQVLAVWKDVLGCSVSEFNLREAAGEAAQSNRVQKSAPSTFTLSVFPIRLSTLGTLGSSLKPAWSTAAS